MKSKKLLLTVLFAGLFAVTSFSQSNPAAFNLASGNYTFAAWDAASPAGTYPSNMVFHVDSIRETLNFNAVANYVCPYNLTSRARINGRNADGFSFLNVGQSLNNQCNSAAGIPTTIKKFMGAAVLAIKTLGREQIQLTWKGTMFSNLTYNNDTLQGNLQSRVYSIKMQYRTDTTSAFVDVPDAGVFSSNSDATTYKAQGTNEILTATLPGVCNNKTYVQVRWLYYQSTIGGGNRPELGIDDVNVSSTAGNFTSSITANGATSFCQGGNVVLQSTNAASYLWSTGETTQEISVVNSGSYFVTATNANGTTAVSNSIQVTILPAPNAAISFSGASAICDGASVTLNSNLAASYLWSNAATTASIVVATPGDYSVTVTYTNGCTSTSSPVTISNSTSPAVPQITYNGAFDLQSTVAVAYQWLLAGAEIAGANSQFYTPTENGIYAIIVSNENGCTSVSLPYEWLITSLNKNSNSTLEIFPNPSQNHITVVWESEKIKYVHIYDLLGNLVQIEYENFNKINVSNLSSGNYFVRIFNAKGVSENKFLNKQ
ncbi:MAG: T9SS type A sorting domain-containing protein [Bacteroidota bacterium]